MALDPNKWTHKTQEAFAAALDQAKANSNPEVTPDHLMSALFRQDDTLVLPIVQKLGLAPLMLRNRADEAVGRLPKAYGGESRLGRELNQVMERADDERKELHDEYLSTEHLLLAMVDRLDRTREELLAALRDVRGSHRVTSQDPEGQFQALERYGRDLTEVARQGKLDPVIGRTTRSVAPSRSCRAAPRTTRSSSASPASARPRSSKGSRAHRRGRHPRA
jgi:ATP-dependent Clp protease ATP-binding subunit ClpB